MTYRFILFYFLDKNLFDHTELYKIIKQRSLVQKYESIALIGLSSMMQLI